MLTFQEAIDSMEVDETPSILLGNGFSQNWDANIFNYANLLDVADFDDRGDVLGALFLQSGTHDFETVMKHLVAAEQILELYGVDQNTIDQIKNDKSILKKSLVTAISNSHPNLPSDIEDDQFICVRLFLSRFKKIFSLNYDLLLYWARNKNTLEPVGYRTDDGFRANRCWEGYGTDQNVHFLHGGLHIYDISTHIKKHAYAEDEISIIQQVRDNLKQGKFPLFVSEPTYEKKKEKIQHNPYLSYCYQALRDLDGTLFIYGHSMNENDKHIFDQVKLSSVRKVFVGIYGDKNSDPNKKSISNACRFLQSQNIGVEFYQSESASVWQNQVPVENVQ